MVVKFIRWAMGYIEFTVKCNSPEKFINLAVGRGINIWDISKLTEGINAQTMAGEYKNLRLISKKCNAKIRLKNKRGLPFVINKYRKRKGIIVGILVFCTVIYVLSLYIWSIDIQGNNQLTSEEIISVMQDLGLSSGSLKSRIDVEATEQEAMIRLPDIAWISINLKGSHADIQIKERISAPDLVKEQAPCDIKAKSDAVIDRIETYKGTTIVKEGDAVIKGQTLISGIFEDSFGKNTFVHSQAKVYGYTTRKLEKTVNLSQIKPVDTGKVIKRYRLKLFGIEVPLTLWYKTGDNYRYEFSSCNLQIARVGLPFVLHKEQWFEQIGESVTLTYQQALTEAKSQIEDSENDFTLNDVKVVDKYYQDSEVNGACILTGTYKCWEDVGIAEEIQFSD